MPSLYSVKKETCFEGIERTDKGPFLPPIYFTQQEISGHKVAAAWA
jgi:hypothetical protein